VPKPEFEDDQPGDIQTPAYTNLSPSSPTFRQTRLNRYIHDLTLRPNDPPLDMNDPNFRNSNALSAPPTGVGSFYSSSRSAEYNPESDSFLYMESVLESLSVLGRLGSALDSVVQRLATEIYNLVETTIEEVSARAEYGRRNAGPNPTQVKSEGIYVISDLSETHGPVNAFHQFERGANLRLSTLESTSLQSDHEVLLDFFWTLYSKLDAVAQGLRVIYEVANRISSVSSF
jgi:exocyst complex component 4